jgi:hypothetical protein
MTNSEKKALLLLKSIIFMYHGLDDSEQAILIESAAELDAEEELKWVNEFIAEDYYDAFEKSRDFLKEQMMSLDRVKRLEYLKNVWSDNMKKGYISEMEAMGMLKLAKDWEIERDLITAIKK